MSCQGIAQDGKFAWTGFDQAIEKVTANPARILKFPEKIGTLEPGSVADVSVIQIQQGDFELLDSNRQKRTVRERIAPVAAVRAGKLTPAQKG